MTRHKCRNGSPFDKLFRGKKVAEIELIATSSFGLEAVVSRELKKLGFEEQRVEDGKVTFPGDAAAICRANLWLRSAERVLLQMGEFEARDFGVLFDAVYAIDWPELLPVNAEFPVRGRSVRSQLSSVPACQSIVKKAIVEKMKSVYGLEHFPENGPTFAVEFSLRKDRVTIAVDTSGVGLHKRGYRNLVGTAPLKETLAAALVQLSFWNSERPFLDPFCGSGTIPIEAAMIGRNLAPGIQRTFAAESWPLLSPRMWDEARTEARDVARPARDVPLIATDQDESSLRAARHHARRAGVDSDIHFQRKVFEEISTKRRYGCLICNPPYGERSGRLEDAENLYRQMADVLSPMETWSLFIITRHPHFETLFRRKADRRRKLYNGRLECTYYQYHGPRPPRWITDRIED